MRLIDIDRTSYTVKVGDVMPLDCVVAMMQSLVCSQQSGFLDDNSLNFEQILSL